MIILNVDENDLDGQSNLASDAIAVSASRNISAIRISSRIEAELASLPIEEQAEYREELGLKSNSLELIIASGYALLGLITFYTTVGPELRAWTIPKGTPAQAAAGKIHSDMERGFIRADVISADELLSIGSETEAREKGQIRSEGRTYLVQDGDVIRFKFNV